MSDAKTYVFGQDSNCLNTLIPLLQQRGVDPSVLAMLNNGGFGNNNFIWIVFLLILFGWGNNGNWGGNNGQVLNAVNDSTGRDLLMQAINGNGAAIGQLSTKLNCDSNAIQNALNSISAQICNVGNQVGMSGQQVINAIQQGNMNIAQQMAQCCCDNKLLASQNHGALISRIDQLANGVTQGFSATAYETAQQTCSIQNGMRDQTQMILGKLDSIEDARKDREIANLTAQLTASTSRAERAAELAPIYQALNDIKCKQPNTVNVPYQPFVTVPNCVAWQAGYNGFSNTGVWG